MCAQDNIAKLEKLAQSVYEAQSSNALTLRAKQLLGEAGDLILQAANADLEYIDPESFRDKNNNDNF